MNNTLLDITVIVFEIIPYIMYVINEQRSGTYQARNPMF